MDAVKDFYKQHADTITQKRHQSPNPVRRYVHEEQLVSILRYIKPGMRVLDAGCGEGTLAIRIKNIGAEVVGCDLSEPNITASKTYANNAGVGDIEFIIADLEHLPFKDSSFDMVVSSHVLEHLPDFDKGLKEIMRVTKKRAVIAIPTVLNTCSIVQVGHGWFYLKGVRSFLGFPYGVARLLVARLLRREGVDEQYGGGDVPHVFRFPSVMKKKARTLGYKVVAYEASSICLPYFESFLPIIRWLDKYRARPLFRNLGYGTTYVVEK